MVSTSSPRRIRSRRRMLNMFKRLVHYLGVKTVKSRTLILRGASQRRYMTERRPLSSLSTPATLSRTTNLPQEISGSRHPVKRFLRHPGRPSIASTRMYFIHFQTHPTAQQRTCLVSHHLIPSMTMTKTKTTSFPPYVRGTSPRPRRPVLSHSFGAVDTVCRRFFERLMNS